MIDLLPYVAPVAFTTIASTGVFFVRTMLTLNSTMIAHSASDVVMFKNIHESFGDLRQGQRDQTERLNRLIENSLVTAERASAEAAARVTREAASALVVIQNARAEALKVVAEAVSVARTVPHDVK